jgi:SNF family Na+-dependent transporter
MARANEAWGTRLGVILAVAGSAVGLGNFLRFPGQAAEYGGGAFMVAYFISFLIIGLPICWAEWTMGRFGGQKGYNSAPGIFYAVSGKNNAFKYMGVIGVIIPVVIYMYYVYIEAWCLGYAVNFLAGNMHFETADASWGWFIEFVGATQDGSAIGFDLDQVGVYLVLVFILNFVLIYLGINKGIEWFCKYAMPTLVVLALVILVRVLTLGAPTAGEPEWNVNNGLGYMWNPDKALLEEQVEPDTWQPIRMVPTTQREAVRAQTANNPDQRLVEFSLWEQLANPQLWLAAAGQIFFSLSVGFGVIITYSSYMRRNDDVVLSGVSAASANEFAEVGLGGLMILPAGIAFMGVVGVAGAGTFDLGFKVLPLVFAKMPMGWFFGFLFFFLLFLAAVTSSLSMLQPGIAFLEESLDVGRHTSVALLGVLTAIGCGFVVFFSEGVKALDTMDFWVGTFLIFVLATIQVIMFGWIMGIDKGFEEAHKGAAFRIPWIFRPILKYVSPLFLLTIFVLWVLFNVLGVNFEEGGEPQFSSYIRDLFIEPHPIALATVGLILTVAVIFTVLIAISRRYKTDGEREFLDERITKDQNT